MKTYHITVDYNGLVIFSPKKLQEFLGKEIHEGENIFHRFTTTNDGDLVIKNGIVLPILGINDSTYEVIVRKDAEICQVEDGIIFSNGVYPLEHFSKLYIADMAVFVEWEVGTGWHEINLPHGFYGVTVRGFRYILNDTVVRFGYDILFKMYDALPEATASMEQDMQTLYLP